jgi:ribosomal protein S18 acetylase RimI-like enzyme
MVQTSISAWLTKQTPKKPTTGNHAVPGAAGHEEPPSANTPPARHVNEIGHVQASKADVMAATGAPTETRDRFNPHRPLPPNARITAITAETISQFKRLISVVLPVPYSDTFYKETLSDPVAASVSLIALWQDDQGPPKARVVAGIRCRVLARSPAAPEQPKWKTAQEFVPFLKSPEDNTQPCLYISTIGTLSPFRNLGLGGALLREVIRAGVELYDVGCITAHVWEASDEARCWYAKLGFKEVKYMPDYYRRLSPNGAWVVERPILPSDFLDQGSITAPTLVGTVSDE